LALTSWLIDKSALARLGTSPDAETWAERISRGLVHITTVTLLEVGFSARSGSDLRQAVQLPPLSLLPIDYLTPAIEQRAIQVQMRLAEEGKHRAPAIPDLLIAAAAELTRRTVLHLDKDFELIAGVTGQETERLRR
jgi:predicted nucleic acid-binding protein